MDLTATKKRKADENGAANASPSLTLEDAQKIVSSLSLEQLRSIVASSLLESPSVLSSVRLIADKDTAQRKLFIRGLSWETTTDSIRSLFSTYGEVEEAVVIVDKNTGKSRGFGFITFKHIDGALLALKDPSKQIDGRMTVTQLASAGNIAVGPATGPAPPAPDVSLRKIYVGSVPADMQSDRLLHLFSTFGEIEEGPLGFDKNTGKFRGYALFVYKTVESARAAIEEPNKIVDGHHMICKLANTKDVKMMKPNVPVAAPGAGMETKPGDVIGGFGSQSSLPGSQYGGPGSGLSSYGGGFSAGGPGMPGSGGLGHHHLNSPLQSSIGSGLPGQVPSTLGGAGGYGGGGFGGPYGSSQFSSVPGSAAYGGLGMGSSLYNRLAPSSGGYSEPGPYSLSSLGHSGQHHQPGGSPHGPRVPPGGGMYQGLPPYY